MKLVSSILMVMVLCCLAGCPASRVYPVTGAEDSPSRTEDGVYYALPKTAIRVTVAETYRTLQPQFPKSCEAAVLTRHALPLVSDDVVSRETTAERFALPDPDAIFKADLSSWYLRNKEHTFAFSEAGTMESAAATMEDKTVSTVASVVGTVVGAVVGGATGLTGGTGIPKSAVKGQAQAKAAVPAGCRIYVDYATRLAVMETEQQKLVDLMSKAENSNQQSVYAKAIETYAAQIEDYTGRLYKLGTEVRTYGGVLVPSGGAAVRCGSADTTPDGDSMRFGAYDAQWCAYDSGDFAARIKQDFGTREDRGFYYRIPVLGELQVKSGEDILHRMDVPVAQKGVLVALPSKFGSSNVVQTATFHDKSGALKTLDVRTKALEEESISNATSLLGEVIENAKAKDAAQELADDTLTKLTREAELLQLQLEIKEARESLEE